MNVFIDEREDPKTLFTIIQKINTETNNICNTYKVRHKKTGQIFIAKIFNKYNNEFSEKIKSLKKFENPYIVKYLQSFILNNTIWILTEFCNCGSAKDIIKLTHKFFKENEIASILLMILKGLQFLHNQKKIHGSIKSSNILLNTDGIAKLGDFCTNINALNNFIKKKQNFFNPPELKKNNMANINFKTDIWYIGILCIELAEGLSSENKNVKGLKNSSLWSNEFNDFIQKCLSDNQINRPTAALLLAHPFILKYNNNKNYLRKRMKEVKLLLENEGDKCEKVLEENQMRKDSLEKASFNDNSSLNQLDENNNNNNLKQKNNSCNKTRKIAVNRMKQNNNNKKIANSHYQLITTKNFFKNNLYKNKNMSIEIANNNKNLTNSDTSIIFTDTAELFASKKSSKLNTSINKYIKSNKTNKYTGIKARIGTENLPCYKHNLIKLLNKYNNKDKKNINIKNISKINKTEKPRIHLKLGDYNSNISQINQRKTFLIGEKKKHHNNNSIVSIDSLINSSIHETNKKANVITEKKIKSKTKKKKSNGGNQNLSSLINLNKSNKKICHPDIHKKNKLRNLILDKSNKNIINSNKNLKENIKNNSLKINKNSNNSKKYSKTPNSYNFKSKYIKKKLQRPPVSNSISKKNNNCNNTYIDNIHVNRMNLTKKRIEFENNNNKFINKNQSYSYDRNDRRFSLSEKEINKLCQNNNLNEKILPELITQLAGTENKMNQEIQKIKEEYEPLIKIYKDSIQFLKKNPFLKNVKEYKKFELFKQRFNARIKGETENKSINSSNHKLNIIKISNYRSNDINELNITNNKENAYNQNFMNNSVI